MIKSLSEYDPSLERVYQDGLSDLCFEGKKIAGTSLFRSRNYLLYQASILCDGTMPLINRYLKHPSKEPSYRKGKDHSLFVTDLSSILGSINLGSIEQIIRLKLPFFLKGL